MLRLASNRNLLRSSSRRAFSATHSTRDAALQRSVVEEFQDVRVMDDLLKAVREFFACSLILSC